MIKILVIILFLCNLVACNSSGSKQQDRSNPDSGKSTSPQNVPFSPSSRDDFFLPNDKKRLDLEETESKALAKQADQKGVSSSPDFSVCDRTNQVKQAIMQKSEKTNCAKITAQDLKAIKYLDLQNKGITALKSLDFQGLLHIEYLFLEDNQLSALPNDILKGLNSLEYLVLWNNQFSDSERTKTKDWSKSDSVKIVWSKG